MCSQKYAVGASEEHKGFVPTNSSNSAKIKHLKQSLAVKKIFTGSLLGSPGSAGLPELQGLQGRWLRP